MKTAALSKSDTPVSSAGPSIVVHAIIGGPRGGYPLITDGSTPFDALPPYDPVNDLWAFGLQQPESLEAAIQWRGLRPEIQTGKLYSSHELAWYRRTADRVWTHQGTAPKPHYIRTFDLETGEIAMSGGDPT